MKKSSVIFLRSNPVDPDSRVEKEVECLLKAGYDVKILAWERKDKYKMKKSFLHLRNGQAEIYRFGIPAEFGAGKKNLKAFILFQFRLFTWLLKNKKEYDIIHACDFDTAFTAYNVTKLVRKKLIFDIFDYLYTDTSGRNQYFKKFIVHLQHKIINAADGTIICTEERKNQIRGSRPKRLEIIHNSPPSTAHGCLNKLQLDEKKVKIAYVGILQDHRFLIELAEVVREIPECELHIGGFGKYENHFIEMSNKNRNILYYGKLPYQKTIELESSCDIMTAIYDPSVEEHYYAAPNKFYESLMLGKPIIMVENTGMCNMVVQYNIGEVIKYNKQSLKEGIINLIKRKNEWPVISKQMKDLYNQYYSWSEMEKRLVKLYQDIEVQG